MNYKGFFSFAAIVLIRNSFFMVPGTFDPFAQIGVRKETGSGKLFIIFRGFRGKWQKKKAGMGIPAFCFIGNVFFLTFD
jgi:hypothetical protein